MNNKYFFNCPLHLKHYMISLGISAPKVKVLCVAILCIFCRFWSFHLSTAYSFYPSLPDEKGRGSHKNNQYFLEINSWQMHECGPYSCTSVFIYMYTYTDSYTELCNFLHIHAYVGICIHIPIYIHAFRY